MTFGLKLKIVQIEVKMNLGADNVNFHFFLSSFLFYPCLRWQLKVVLYVFVLLNKTEKKKKSVLDAITVYGVETLI